MILKDVEPMEVFAANAGEYDMESHMAGMAAVLEKLDSLPAINRESLRHLRLSASKPENIVGEGPKMAR